MIQVDTMDHKSITICGKLAKADIKGDFVIVTKGNEVFLIAPLTNIKSLVKVEGK